MTNSTQRTVARWIHIIFGLPFIGLVYGPLNEVAPYMNYFRFGFMPILLITGLWMWQGPRVRRMIGEKLD